ncbi:sarcosine oxidase subunit alpha family protein, partial [Mesorhizobium sp. M00.F.Ca.ET.038.03.1.1]
MAGDQANRLTSGGLIDRSTALSFRFDGKTLLGFKGDTLASALVANGVKLVGRSFKYHRPRGILTAGSEEPNALVELRSGARREPNTKATTAELYEGLEAASQNRWPSLNFDVMSVNQLFAPIFVAGFYYKTFMWPAKFWEAIYEPAIRRAAGLGRAAGVSDPDHYDKAWAHCDVVIAGSGPAGLAAALAAGRSGARVILCEEDFVLGGRLLADGGPIDGLPAAEWVARAVAELTVMPDVRIMTRTSLFGVYDGGTYGAIERVNDHLPVPPEHQVRQRLWRIVAKRCVVAAGAIERPIVFAGNDTPGVMMASAMRSYINRYAATPARHIAVFTNNEDGWRTAETAIAAGLQVAAVIDARPDVSPAHRSLASKGGFPVLHGSVSAVDGGKTGVRKISVSLTGGARAEVEADGLAVSGGWNPAVGLTSYHRGRPKWRDDIAAFVPDGAPPGMVAAGAANGAFGLGACLREGFEAGAAAARDAGRGGNIGSMPVADDAAFSLTPLWHVAGKGKAFVDQQHDVTASDVELAQREGFQSVEHLKRYTTLGMATDQGKNSNVPGLAIMAEALGKPIPEVGTTRFRPPYTAVSIGSLAAERFGDLKPERLTPMHDWHIANGARMYSAGLWYRPMIYGLPGETVEQAYVREASATRDSAGIVDVSTLGKIAVQGPDAAEFLDRVYTNMFSTLAVSKARYGLMLREDGLAFDDGTTWRLGEQDFLMTTTTANAGKVMQHLEYFLDVIWPELKVTVTSVTDEWAGAAIGGPNARAILAACVTGTAVDNATLPFMGIVHGRIAGVPVMICRLSFSGEMAFEVYSGAGYGTLVWEALIEAGKPFGLVTYGLEALGTMRIEKGHVTGAEIDGRTTARDLHLDWMLSKKKPFIGSAMMDREGLIAPDRLELVGLI